jgi:RHS repeat-associated protein
MGEIVNGAHIGILTGLHLDEVIARYTAQGPRVFLTDALNTVLAQTREDRSVQNYYTYSPYGETEALGPDEGNSLKYTARESDATGLYYYRARYYDPVLKRFVNEDPIGVAGGWNVYSYVGGNPTFWVDPLGLAGVMTIHSSGNGGPSMTDGHSWIAYTPDGSTTTTYGTWGNNPQNMGNGLHENLETGRIGDASRSTRLNDAQEKKFMDVINDYKARGDKGWKFSDPCSTFARDAWKAATGENLNIHWGPISNPTTLKQSIIKANGGASHLGGITPKTGSSANSCSCPGSSSSSSGSSLNSAGSIF